MKRYTVEDLIKPLSLEQLQYLQAMVNSRIAEEQPEAAEEKREPQPGEVWGDSENAFLVRCFNKPAFDEIFYVSGTCVSGPGFPVGEYSEWAVDKFRAPTLADYFAAQLREESPEGSFNWALKQMKAHMKVRRHGKDYAIHIPWGDFIQTFPAPKFSVSGYYSLSVGDLEATDWELAE